MEITANSTPMEAGLCVAPDKEGRDYCVVVVKGTFAVDHDGTARVADDQEPVVYTDAHYGDPGESSVRYECDFARYKPRADLLLNGSAHSPTGRPVASVDVSLEYGTLRKVARVTGDRYWRNGGGRVQSSQPEPFVTMPVVFDRAYGGSDHRHEDPKYHGSEMRNPVGTGFHRSTAVEHIADTRLPNVEDPRAPYQDWSDRPAPIGFGVIGRSWHPRIGYAGTYDDAWLNNRFPFLPTDFDDRYFQTAPQDQQVSFPRGGEVIRCTNLSAAHTFVAELPRVDVPIAFGFRDGIVMAVPNLDTIIVEPENERLILVWRACIDVGRKMHSLQEITVGRQPRPTSTRSKPHFGSLAEFIEWKRGVR